MIFPDRFVQSINGVYAERGQEWLERLPALLDEVAARWSLTLLPHFPNLSFNYVAPVVRADGSEAVLKAGIPNPEIASEMAALRLYEGRSAVRLLEVDSESSVFLLERVRPGVVLTTLADEANDAQATSIAASVMRGLWRPVPPGGHPFKTVRDWGGGLEKLRPHFGGSTGPFPERLVEEAETLFDELLASADEPVLLHGDLHHDNILSSERGGWLAIDPKGILGEPAYEVGAMLRNLWRDRHTIIDPARLVKRRIYQLSEELGIDRARIRGWAVAQAVLSAWWCVEDNSDCWEGGLETAERLAAMR